MRPTAKMAVSYTHLDVYRRQLSASSTAIQPLLVGGNEASVRLSEHLFSRGLWVPAIRPPTVPAGAARLRISLSAALGLSLIHI